MIRFADIFGQDTTIAWLKQAYASNRLPHAMLFAGPIGVGKGTTALAVATLFLCEKPSGTDPCGHCDSCRLMSAADEPNHPDFHRVYRQLIRREKKTSVARDLAIDTIRDHVVRPAGLKASMARGKVFVIEEADTMNLAAQNALLKTLEEPIGRTLIILLTDQPGALLPTIRSRCQLVRFLPLNQDLVARELIKRGIDARDATDAAKFTEGSMGMAQQWIADGILTHARFLHSKLAQLIAGASAADLPEWFKQAGEEFAAKLLDRDDLASKDQSTREGMLLYLRIAANELRKQLREVEGEDAERLCSAIDAVNLAGTLIESNVNVSLIFQQLAIQLDRQFATVIG